MAAHKHAAMIKAKADNMDLVVLRKHHDGDWIEVADQSEVRIKQSGEYFLCLPKHKKAVLCGLNGGNFQVRCLDEFSEGWYLNPSDWGRRDIWYMLDSHESRIKPSKENRWIAVNNSGYATPMTFISKQECENYVSVSYQKCPGVTWQHIEIEVEV